MIKIEAVITVWKDGLFKSMNRIEADNFTSLIEQLEFMIINIKDKIREEQESKYRVADDDDIPF